MGNRHSSKRKSPSESSLPKRRRAQGNDWLSIAGAGFLAALAASVVTGKVEPIFPSIDETTCFVWLSIVFFGGWYFWPDLRFLRRAGLWLLRRASATVFGMFRRRAPATQVPVPRSYYEVLDLTPSEFEHFAAAILKRMGFQEAIVTGKSRDLGVDVEGVDDRGRHVVVQCKKRGSGQRVGSPDLQPITSALGWKTLTSYGGRAEYGVFFTLGEYTPDALSLALDRNVIPIDQNGIKGLLHLGEKNLFRGEARDVLNEHAAWRTSGASVANWISGHRD